MTNKHSQETDLFDSVKNLTIPLNGFYAKEITVEELYQHFRERLTKEITTARGEAISVDQSSLTARRG